MTEVSFTIDPRVYRLSAVKKTAYRFGDRCFVRIEVLAEGGIHVGLTAKSERTPPQTLEGDFRNELLDQDLRESISEQTERVRNLLLAQAFSRVSSRGAPADTADYRDDPLRIGEARVGEH